MTKQNKTNPSPYIDGRKEWEERYGTEIGSKRRWQIVAIISLSIAFVAIIGTVYLSATNHVQPYIVEVNKNGGIIQVTPASKENYTLKKKVLKAQLTSFVHNVRDVIVDAHQQRSNVYQVYAFLRENTPANTKITNFFRTNDPFERARKETVFTEIVNILELKENAYEIEWRETIMDRTTGTTHTVTNYKMIAYIALSPPTDDENIIKNPLGLIVKDLNWTKEI